MIVSRSNFESVVSGLCLKQTLAVDTETTGLRPYHGDRLFSIIIADELDGYYFNFQAYQDIDPDYVLTPSFLSRLAPLFSSREKLWFAHNAKFDLAMLANEGIEIGGEIHCTKAQARVEYNEHLKYDLSSCLERLGLAKDDTVEKYIEEHKLYEKIDGETKKFYHKVPFEIIAPYGIRDATGTFALGQYQIKSIKQKDSELSHTKLLKLQDVSNNERRLTKTIFKMERRGIRIDKEYTMRAASYERDQCVKLCEGYRKESGKDFKASAKDFAELFKDEKEKWVYTKKGNPSFTSEVIENFSHPAARTILQIRQAKSKVDFYEGFLKFSDSSGYVHPNFNPDGAAHGRFSSSSPNFQNLTSEDNLDQEFLTRRCIIPSPGFVFIMPDYDQMEYRFLLELCCRLLGYETPLVTKVKGGLDVHTATAEVGAQGGVAITREMAKTSNFLTIYGGGVQKLAHGLKCSTDQARKIRHAIFSGAPEMQDLITTCQNVILQTPGNFIVNWLGRRCYFPDTRFAYRGPNYLIAGGCADIVKVAMNRIDDYLVDKKSRLIMTVHDELPCEIHESEVEFVPRRIKEIMQTTFESKYLPLTCGMEWSAKSLADKQKGFPT